MKKITTILIVGFLNSNMQGQNFDGGIILGLSSSQVAGDNLSGFRKAGVLIGVFANKPLSELINLQMEMTYIQKGSNNPNMNNYEHNDVERQDISSSYIEIPLLLQYNQSNNIQIETGILAGYLIDGYYNDSQGRIPKYNESNPFISYDFGALIGFNYKYSKKISLNTRISNSILPIGTEDKRKFLTKGKYNTVLSFTLNYTI